MKKIIAMLLVTISCLSIVACGASTESGNSNEDVNVAGTYHNVTFLSSSSFTLNENSTYDRTVPNEKGTYETSKKGIILTDTNDDETIFAQKDNYFYRTNLICCFEEDEDYGLEPTFDDNGMSNQWFCAYYDTISDSKWNVIILQLNEDGTFKLRDCTRDAGGSQSDGTVYEGTYTLNDYVLNLNCGEETMPFLFIDDKIYFDVYEKQD